MILKKAFRFVENAQKSDRNLCTLQICGFHANANKSKRKSDDMGIFHTVSALFRRQRRHLSHSVFSVAKAISGGGLAAGYINLYAREILFRGGM